jgi:hypothetical protein
MGSFGVVVAQGAFQIEAEAGLFGDQVAGEGGLPALLQDGLLDPLHTPIRLGTAGPDEAVTGSQLSDAGLEGGRAELLGVVAHDPLQPPAAGGQVGGHRPGQGAGPGGRGVAAGHLEGGPGIGGGDVDGRVLPDGPLGATEPADAEAIELDQLAGVVDVQVAFRERHRPLRRRWSGIAGDQAVALGPGVQAVATQHPPHPLVDNTIPPHLGRASSAAMRAGPEAGMAQGQGDHPLLDQGAGGIGHVRHPALPWPQDSGPCRSSCRFHR